MTHHIVAWLFLLAIAVGAAAVGVAAIIDRRRK
jgi:hypothetical protein